MGADISTPSLKYYGEVYNENLQTGNSQRENEENWDSMTTKTLLNNLENRIKETYDALTNIKTCGKQDGEKRKRVRNLMCDAELFLNAFNTTMGYKSERLQTGLQFGFDSKDAPKPVGMEKNIREKMDFKSDGHTSNASSGIKETCHEQKTSEMKSINNTDSAPASNIPQDPQMENESLRQINKSLEEAATHLQKKLVEFQTKNHELSRNNEELLNRLSKIAGQKLREDNPAITDLSDPNRPTKLGEVYSELYDNEWTDAFEELHAAGYSEMECITTLRLTLLNVAEFCKRKSEGLLKKTEEAVQILFEEFEQTKKLNNFRHLTMPRKLGKTVREVSFEEYIGADIKLQQMWKPKDWKSKDRNVDHRKKVETPEAVTKQLKIFRKEVAESMVPLLQKAYMSASWSEHGCLPSLKPYIKKCLFLGWIMVVQSPPLALSSCGHGDEFNKDMFKDYTKSGPTIDYVVWPALLLHENGPLLGKGVAQGQKACVITHDV